MSNAKNKTKGSGVKPAPNSNGVGNETKTKEVKQIPPNEPTTLNSSKSYTVISLVTNKFLKEGQPYNVSGKLAEKMINNNQAKLKD